jgi:low affinity Fe/Cu permease
VKNLLFLILLLPVFAWAEGPFDGTWKVEINQSQTPQTADAVVLLQNGNFQCISCEPKINIKADGTDQAVPPETKQYDMMALKVVDDNTTETTAKKNGKVVSKTTNMISADGKTSTIEALNFAEDGKQPAYKVTYTYSRAAEAPPGAHAISGTWKMQKANLVASLPMTIKSTPDGLMVSGPGPQSFEAKFDGQDYPVKGAPDGNTVSLSKVNESAIDMTTKQNGKTTTVTHLAVAADGKTMTIKLENSAQGATTSLTATKQ